MDPRGEHRRPIKPDEYWATAAKATLPVPISAGAFTRSVWEAGGRALARAQGKEYEGTRAQFVGQYQKQAMASLGVKTENAPAFDQRIAHLAKVWNEKNGVAPSAQFSASDYADLNTLLRAGNYQGAKKEIADLLKKKTVDQVAKHYESWAEYPFTQKQQTEPAFYQSLTPEQQKAYEKAIGVRVGLSVKAVNLLLQVIKEQENAITQRQLAEDYLK